MSDVKTRFERRTVPGTVELRELGDGQIMVGYAVKWDQFSANMGGFVERFHKGAFTKTLKEADPVALYNHDKSLLLGRLSAGTLRLTEDDTGLRYEVDVPPTTVGRDLAVLVGRGDITGSSFGFRVTNNGESWGQTDSGMPLRDVTEAALRDVSPVTFPAYSSSDVALRYLAEERDLDLDSLVAAAEHDELRELIFPVAPKATPVVRHMLIR